MNKRTKELKFSKETEIQIYRRDKGACLFCKRAYHMHCSSSMLTDIKDIMHYINKSAGGLGIEENGVLGCRYHHGLLDNGNKGLRSEMLGMMEEHLKSIYPDWNEEDLHYKKYEGKQYVKR